MIENIQNSKFKIHNCSIRSPPESGLERTTCRFAFHSFDCIAEQGNPTSVEHHSASLLTKATHAPETTQNTEPGRNEKKSNGGVSGIVSNKLLGFCFFDDRSETSYHLNQLFSKLNAHCHLNQMLVIF
jgi:hypothetical protein